MHPEEFVYPELKEPLLEAYGGHFECACIVLHPFVRVPEELSWKSRRSYPADAEIRSCGAKCRWAEAARGAGIRNCAQLSQALLTTTHALDDFLCDLPSAHALARFLQSEPVWMPCEGRFDPLLETDFLSAFEAAGHKELLFVPEFPLADPPAVLSIDSLRRKEEKFPACGSLVAPDGKFLFTVDWESFFTLFYGPRAFVEKIVKSRQLEGFFAEKETEHFWFNWKMGCATCTVSPEGWTKP